MCCFKNLLLILIVILVMPFNWFWFGVDKVIVTLKNDFVYALISFSLCATKYRSETCICFSYKMYNQYIFDQRPKSHCSIGHTRPFQKYVCVFKKKKIQGIFDVSPFLLYYVFEKYIRLHVLFYKCKIIESISLLLEWTFLRF